MPSAYHIHVVPVVSADLFSTPNCADASRAPEEVSTNTATKGHMSTLLILTILVADVSSFI